MLLTPLFPVLLDSGLYSIHLVSEGLCVGMADIVLAICFFYFFSFFPYFSY